MKTDDFSSVFAFRQRSLTPHVWIFHKPNALGYPRLGLVVAKKCAKRANKRNYMKRRLREWFRRHRHLLQEADYIVQVKTAFDRSEAAAVIAAIETVLSRQSRTRNDSPRTAPSAKDRPSC